MERIPVESSNIADVAHDGENLEVTFRNGSRYRYSGVSAEVFDEFLGSESKGRFLNQVIKGGYSGKRITED